MDNYKLDKFIGIANKNKEKYIDDDNIISLMSMLRVVDDKLYIVVPMVNLNENVWTKGNNIIPKYWVMIDPRTNELLEFNKTSEKSFSNTEIKENDSDDNINLEISKYSVNKKIEYKNYIKNDIKNNQLLLYQKMVDELLNNMLKIDNEEIPLNDYLFANLDSKIDEKISELVDLIAAEKYNSIITYYDILFDKIIDEYLNKNKIDNNKIQLAYKLINLYYTGIAGIENIFNIQN